MLHVMATMLDGSTVVSEFGRLRGIRQLSADVMSGRKPFPVWETIAEVHPASGEVCKVRTRRFVSGHQIVGMEVVVPDDGGGYVAEQRIAEGSAGLYSFSDTEDVPAGGVTGVAYPVALEPESGRRYVTLNASPDEAPTDASEAGSYDDEADLD